MEFGPPTQQAGEPRRLMRCQVCGNRTWHRVHWVEPSSE